MHAMYANEAVKADIVVLSFSLSAPLHNKGKGEQFSFAFFDIHCTDFAHLCKTRPRCFLFMLGLF